MDPEPDETPGFVFDEAPELDEPEPAPESESEVPDPEPDAPMPPLATASGEQSRSQVSLSKYSLALGHSSLKNMVQYMYQDMTTMWLKDGSQ